MDLLTDVSEAEGECLVKDLLTSKPHDLEQHIKDIISQNAAIVETMDPIWVKKYNSSRHHSTSSIPSSRSVFVTSNVNVKGVNSTGAAPSESTSSESTTLDYFSFKRRYSDVSFLDKTNVGSRLQSALMMGSKHHEPVQEETVMKSTESEGSLVRDLLTSKVPLALKKPASNGTKQGTNGSCSLNGDDSENPERSVIRDLLLKKREASTPSDALKTETKKRSSPISLASHVKNGVTNSLPTQDQELSMLYYVCTICKIAFRNKENLEAHKLHYCKGTTGFIPSLFACRLQQQQQEVENSEKNGNSSPTFISHNKVDPFMESSRKISVVDNSVLHRRLTEGRSQGRSSCEGRSSCVEGANKTGADKDSFEQEVCLKVFESKSESKKKKKHLLETSRHELSQTPPLPPPLEPVSLGTILKKTLEAPKKRKISEPVLPSSGHFLRFSSPLLVSCSSSSSSSCCTSTSNSSCLGGNNKGMTETTNSVMSSTRSTYCCINRPQPMFVPQETAPKLSMYSNWKTSPVDEESKGILASYDSSSLRFKDLNNDCFYVVSTQNKSQTLTPVSSVASKSLVDNKDLILNEPKMLSSLKESNLLPTTQTLLEGLERKRKFPSFSAVTGLLHVDSDTSRKISNCEVSGVCTCC